MAEAPWRTLYRAGAACAIAMLALVPVQIAAYLVIPPPETVSGWFALFADRPVQGLVALDLLYMVDIVLAGVLLLALTVALRREGPSLLALSLFFNVTSVAIYFASNPAFEMLALSRRHAGAFGVERLRLEAAAEGLLAGYTGTAYDVSYVLAGVAGLLVAVVMLRSAAFTRVTAVLGIFMGVLALIPPTVGAAGMVAAFLYLAPLWIWLVLVAGALLRLARDEATVRRVHAPLRPAHAAGG